MAKTIEAEVEQVRSGIAHEHIWAVWVWRDADTGWQYEADFSLKRAAATYAKRCFGPTAIVHIHIPAMDY